MSGKRYPGVGRELTQFGDALSDKDYENINSEWQQLSLARNFVGISLDDSEYLKEQVERIENNVIFAFDFAISAVELFRDLLFFLPNFMNAVINYIVGIIYNALESLMRLGIYSLVVPPNLSDVSFEGLPTTDLKEQAANAYKKFYDYSDPNLPYAMPFEKGLAEEIIDSGEKIKNKYKYYLQDSTLAEFLNPSGDDVPPYMERDFLDFKTSVKNLERTGGVYDAIYLYFSIDYGAGAANVLNFINAIAKFSDILKLPSLEGILKEYDSLFRPKRKTINVLCTNKIEFPNGMTRSVKKNSLQNVKKIDIETNKRTYNDPDLENFRIFESEPIEFMSEEKKVKIRESFQEQLDQAKEMQSVANEDFINSEIEKRYTQRLNSNDAYNDTFEDADKASDEIKYYAIRSEISAFLDNYSTDMTNTKFLELLFSYFGRDNQNYISVLRTNFISPSNVLGDISEIQTAAFKNPENYTNTVTFFDSIYNQLYPLETTSFTDFKEIYKSARSKIRAGMVARGEDINDTNAILEKLSNNFDFFSDLSITEQQAKTLIESGTEIIDDSYYPVVIDSNEDITNLRSKIVNLAYRIRLESAFTITPPDIANEERIKKLQEILDERTEIEEKIRKNVEESVKENITDRIQKIVDEKQSQLDYVDGIEKSPTDLIKSIDDSGKIVFLDNYYPSTNRTSLYQSYLEKFYNFDAVADADFVYKFTIELDGSGKEFTNRQDSFHSGQFVQIRENIGSEASPSYEYRGSGIIIDSVKTPYEDSGYGTWAKANFTDIIGITADIKRLQNEVLGFKNLFEPNTSYFDVIIKFLKDIKKRILEVIFILDKLIDMLNLLLSIQLNGNIMGKYIREESSYDLMAKALTDTSNLSMPIQKKNFDPTKLSSVQHYLNKIRSVDPDAADRILDEISIEATKVSDDKDEERKKIISEESVIAESYPPAFKDELDALKTTSNQLQTDILNELSTRADSIVGLVENASAALVGVVNPDSYGFVEPEESLEITENASVVGWEAALRYEIAMAEAKLTNQFGFSLILLSYLPKGLPMYPVRFMAERIGLIEQDPYTTATQVLVNDNGMVSPYSLNTLDPAQLAALMPNYNLNDLKGMLIDKSINRNPSVWHKPKPTPISVMLEPLVGTEDFVFDITDTNTLEGDSSFLSVGGNSIKILKSMQTKYLAGAKLFSTSNNPISLPRNNGNLNSNYKYLYEFTLDAGPNSALICNSDETVDVDKIQIHFGIFVQGQNAITKKAFELNGNGNQIFSFGRRTVKTFRGEIYLKQDKATLIPYILIGYNGMASLENFNFQLKDSVIYLYRVA